MEDTASESKKGDFFAETPSEGSSAFFLLYFRRLYLPCLSRYLKNFNALFFTTPRTPILFLQLFDPRPFKCRLLRQRERKKSDLFTQNLSRSQRVRR